MEIQKIIGRFKGPLLVFAVVIVANILFLTGVFKSNPIDSFSGQVTFTRVGLYGIYNTIDPNNAYSTQALGHEAANDLLHGHMPWWNYYEQVGAPLAGDMQPAALFLPFVLLLEFSSGVLFFHMALEIIAGIATYYLLKKLKCSELAATLGGSLFAINGTFAWFGTPNVNPIAFLPLLILGIEIALDKSESAKRGGWILIAVALAFSLYAGFPEAAYLDGILAGLWFLVRAIQLRRSNWLGFSLKVATGMSIGLLLAAPILVAFLDYLRFANVGAHAGTLSHYSMPGSVVPALVMPYIYGPIFQFTSYDHTGTLIQFWDNIGGYLTLSALFLALISLFSHKRKNRAIIYMLGIFSLIVIGRNYGFPGLTEIINLIPGMKQVAVYRYVNPTLELAIVIMAMLGLDAILSTKKSERPSRGTIITAGLIVLVIVLCFVPVAVGVDHHLYLAPHHRLWLALSAAWSLGSVGLMVFSSFFLKQYLKFLIPAIILIDALVMFVAPQLSSPRATILDQEPVHYLQANLGTSRFYSLGYIMPNYGSYYGIASINTNNEPVPQAWYSYIPSHLNPNVNPAQEFTGIDMLTPNGITPVQAFLKNMPNYESIGVKYVVVRNSLLLASTAKKYAMRSVYSDNYFTIYQLAKPRPYFQVVDGGCLLTNGSRDTINAQCSGPSTIIRRELYAPGWTANVNGKTIPVSKFGPLFQRVAVQRGHSTVKFNYTPPHMTLGYAVFGLGAILIIYSARRRQTDKARK